jgi:phosphohistidine phosphatase
MQVRARELIQEMKTLLLMRHAKSSRDDPDLADHDRPLNKRGKRDAPRMGRWLARQRLVPDLIVSSTAVRAQRTAEKLAEACHYPSGIVLQPELYQASPETWQEYLADLPEPHARVLCVGHNPEIEQLLAAIVGESVAMTTAAIAHLTVSIGGWAEFDAGARVSLQAVWRPKEIDLPEDD